MTTIKSSTRKGNRLKKLSPAVSRKPVLTAPERSGTGNGNEADTNGRSSVNSSPTKGGNLSQREQLTHERNQVLEELARLRAELLETPESTGDEVDLSVYDREKTLGLVKAFERRLEKLETALQATEKGEYGICQHCGKPIDAERLKIFPETRHCVKCKIEQEQQARRRMMQ